MEAKDTEITVNQIGDIMQPCVSPTAQGVIVAQQQAEISFMAGIKEVVEWVERYRRGEGYYQFEVEEWREFLKSEGIE